MNDMETDNNDQEELTLLDIFEGTHSRQEVTADLLAKLRLYEGIVRFKIVTQEGDIQFTLRIICTTTVGTAGESLKDIKFQKSKQDFNCIEVEKNVHQGLLQICVKNYIIGCHFYI